MKLDYQEQLLPNRTPYSFPSPVALKDTTGTGKEERTGHMP